MNCEHLAHQDDFVFWMKHTIIAQADVEQKTFLHWNMSQESCFSLWKVLTGQKDIM